MPNSCAVAIILSENNPAFDLLLKKMEEMDFVPTLFQGIRAFNDSIAQTPPVYDFLILCEPFSFAETTEILLSLKSSRVRAIPIYAFAIPPDMARLLQFSEIVNHFFYDAGSESQVAKKLSNLKALFRLIDEKHRLNKMEKMLEEESSKLVEVNVNNVKLISEIHQKNKLLEVAKRDIQNLLDNLDQGFLTITKDGIVQPGYSKAVEKLFHLSPLGEPLHRLLRIPEEKLAHHSSWLEMTFNESASFDVMKGLGEMEIQLEDRYLELDYRPIRNPDGKIEKIIVIATDKTQEKKFEHKAKKEEAFARTILKITKDRTGFLDFLMEAGGLLDVLAREVGKEPAAIDLSVCFRHAHTLKGNAAAYDLLEVRDASHQLEDVLSEFREGPPESSGADPETQTLQMAVQALRTAFDQSMEAIETALGKMEDTLASTVVLDRSEVSEFEAMLLERFGQDPLLRSQVDDLFYHNHLGKYLLRYQPIVEGIAERMGKKAALAIRSDRIKVNIAPYKPLIQSLIHAFRNALDHGIEFPDERADKGKPPEGRIQVNILKASTGSPEFIELVLEDDGQGISPDTLKKKLLERGYYRKEELDAMPPRQIYRTLLRPGFSTKEEVSEWSGRGVGLDAVAEEVSKLKGEIEIESEEGRYTRLILRVPVLMRSRE